MYKLTKNKTEQISSTFLIQEKTRDIKYYVSFSVTSDHVSHNILTYQNDKHGLNDNIIAQYDLFNVPRSTRRNISIGVNDGLMSFNF